ENHHSIYEQYETVIGLEVHVQLATQSKAFCGDDARFGAAPNTHISSISLGHPGTLPRLNSQQVIYAIRLGLALGSQINLNNQFDRKNYFYADLPKGYQITQDRAPICIGGQLQIPSVEQPRSIRIHHIHMEEDAGKSIHDLDPQFTFVDLNRAGVPLLEIVTEPDLRSPQEVDAFMTNMRQLVRYLGVSDGNMEEGSMRCDCNVSVRRKGSTKLGERCEIKNVNSMRFARKAIAYESKRQIDILEAGGQIQQQTLNFDPVTGVTSPLRDKEEAHDYRYFPDPDLPPLQLEESLIAQIQAQMAPLPWELTKAFCTDYQLSEYDAQQLTEEKEIALYFQRLTAVIPHHKALANLIINKIKPWLKTTKSAIDQFPISVERLQAFIDLIAQNKVSAALAYQRLFPALLEQPQAEVLALAESLNIVQSADEDFLEQLIEAALQRHPEQVKQYQKGKKNLL
ncbi:MAG: Asp-tRNA(Asn)/Glu-tRNA(Gln) amidotransferase subunit GatB, partial [Bacteroidota bacterium]